LWALNKISATYWAPENIRIATCTKLAYVKLEIGQIELFFAILALEHDFVHKL